MEQPGETPLELQKKSTKQKLNLNSLLAQAANKEDNSQSEGLKQNNGLWRKHESLKSRPVEKHLLQTLPFVGGETWPAEQTMGYWKECEQLITR